MQVPAVGSEIDRYVQEPGSMEPAMSGGVGRATIEFPAASADHCLDRRIAYRYSLCASTRGHNGTMGRNSDGNPDREPTIEEARQ